MKSAMTPLEPHRLAAAGDDPAHERRAGTTSQMDARPPVNSSPDGSDSRVASNGLSGAPVDLERWLSLAGSVIAPTTLLTALLFYFGYVSSLQQYAYFGIDIDAIGLSTQDYLLRSPEALFLPIGVLLVTGLLGLWAHAALTRMATPDGHRRLRICAWVLVVVGAILFARGVIGVLIPYIASREAIAMTPICLGVGIALIGYGRRVLYRLRTASTHDATRQPWIERGGLAVVIGLIVLSVFWASTSFAAAYGRGRALTLAEQLSDRPGVIIDTKERLWIRHSAVQETKLPVEGSQEYHYRYRGLRLLIQSKDRMFLIPERWSQDEDVVTLVVPVDNTVRIQFVP
jgi:hypothetical protein